MIFLFLLSLYLSPPGAPVGKRTLLTKEKDKEERERFEGAQCGAGVLKW